MDAALRALADETRRRIVALAWDRDCPAGEVARHFEMSRPAVSQHLKVLLDAGLIHVRREGTKRLYRADPATVMKVRRLLEEFWNDRLRRLKLAAEAEERRKR